MSCGRPLREAAPCSTPRPLHPARSASRPPFPGPEQRHPLTAHRRGPRHVAGLTSVAHQRAGGGTRSAWANASASPAPCWGSSGFAPRRAHSTGSTPRGSAGPATRCATLAAEGRTVLVSSHLINEMSLTAGATGGDRARLPAHRRNECQRVHVPEPRHRHRARWASPMAEPSCRPCLGWAPRPTMHEDGSILASGMTSGRDRANCAARHFSPSTVSPQRFLLQDAFTWLTQDAVEFHSAVGVGGGGGALPVFALRRAAPAASAAPAARREEAAGLAGVRPDDRLVPGRQAEGRSPGRYCPAQAMGAELNQSSARCGRTRRTPAAMVVGAVVRTYRARHHPLGDPRNRQLPRLRPHPPRLPLSGHLPGLSLIVGAIGALVVSGEDVSGDDPGSTLSAILRRAFLFFWAGRSPSSAPSHSSSVRR